MALAFALPRLSGMRKMLNKYLWNNLPNQLKNLILKV